MEANKCYVHPLTETHEIWQSCFVRKVPKGQQKISDSDSANTESDNEMSQDKTEVDNV